MSRKRIEIHDYNPEWAKLFGELKRVFCKKLHQYIIRVEHVGSTSIDGMKAKPIIDIDIIIDKNDDVLDDVVEGLKELGYRHVGDL